jgi:hypothetical protein
MPNDSQSPGNGSCGGVPSDAISLNRECAHRIKALSYFIYWWHLKVTWNAFKSRNFWHILSLSVINNEFNYVCFGFFKEINHFIAACPTLICGCLLLQIFKTAVIYFAAWWRLWRQCHCCVSLFAYYYEVKSRDRTTNIRTLAYSHAHLQTTQWFSLGAVWRKPDTYLNRILLSIDFMHMCKISTHNDGRLPVPDLSVQFPLHRRYVMTLSTAYAHACTTEWPRSVVGIRNVLTLTSWCRRNVIVTSFGSGDSPLFPGLPEQKPNIAEGNATWF